MAVGLAVGSGSSPRGRGTQQRQESFEYRQRFIPAWAGNTRRRRPGVRPPTVHPRAGGEHLHEAGVLALFGGSSPRGRGTPRTRPRTSAVCRFIPARAGNTQHACAQCADRPVHPRAGGEHSSELNPPPGSVGSSPRGRGTRCPGPSMCDCMRFIPARAGNTPAGGNVRRGGPVHPRAGGEHHALLKLLPALDGSSPRGRGTRVRILTQRATCRFIPARAGNTGGCNPAL